MINQLSLDLADPESWYGSHTGRQRPRDLLATRPAADPAPPGDCRALGIDVHVYD